MSDNENSIIKAGVIIPVFNVENTIEKVLSSIGPEVLEHLKEILFIDNHSSDHTVSIIQSYMKANPEFASRVTLVLNEENYGYGHSIKFGFEYFSNQEVSHVIVIHGDHQSDPNRLMGDLLNSTRQNPKLDFVLASRFKSESNLKGYSLIRKLGNHFFNLTTLLCTGLYMSDSGTAMIIMKRDILHRVDFKSLSNSWKFHPQLNILLYGSKGINISEIPMTWADSDAPSTVPLILYGLDLLKMLAWYRFAKTILRKDAANIFPKEKIRSDRRFNITKFH